MSSVASHVNGKGGLSGVPAASRKMVQSLKEIVNCSEQEIYAMLKECNMDPNDAVNRLLSQDPFHEVKSKREKKKESKEITESRSRGGGSSAHRGGRVGSDRYAGRSGLNQFSSSEFGAFHAKAGNKRENDMHPYAGSASSTVAGHNWARQSPPPIDVPAEDKVATISCDDITSASQPSASQSAWVGIPGQVSMADIVRMGKPHGKVSNTSHSYNPNADHYPVLAPTLAGSHHNLCPIQDDTSQALTINPEAGVLSSQHVFPDDDWPVDEQLPAVGMSSTFEEPADNVLYAHSSNTSISATDQGVNSQLGQVLIADDGATENNSADYVLTASASVRNVHEDEDGCRGASLFDNDMYKNVDSFQSHVHTGEHQVEDCSTSASSVATTFQHLNLQKDDQWMPPEDDENFSVKIPSHLLVQSADCSHLSFGSFGSGNNAAFSGPLSSPPIRSNLEEAPEAPDASSAGHTDTRNAEYYRDEHLRTTSGGNLVHITGADAGSFDSPSSSQPEVLKQEIPESAQETQYSFPSSAPGYTFENTQKINTTLAHSQTSSQMPSLAPFSSVVANTNSLPNMLLAPAAQPMREPDIPYSPFSMTQAISAKYNIPVSSIGGSSITVPEGLRAGTYSTQPIAQTPPTASVGTGSVLPQHVAVHAYSQPTLPLGHFANMISYPFLPQNYTYMPSAFQQAFAGNNTYHQSLAAVLPQYKNSVSVSSLPQSASIASGYSAFGSSASTPGNFPLNLPSAPANTTMGYDDILSSQLKDSNHMLSLQQQNENSGMWVHGPGSRVMSAMPASTYYSFQGQNQQPTSFRQGQQLSHHYGALGYPNLYHPQTGLSMEHQQQNPRDASLGSQAQPSKQSQQIWQNSY